MGSFKPWVAFALASSGTVTNATVTSEKFENWGAKGCVIVINRTAETGNCTLDAKLQGYDRASDTWYDVQSASFVQFADGATGVRYIVVYPGIVADDADASVAIATNYKNVSAFLPHEFRLSVTHGGTSVANTFSATIHPLA